MRTSTSTSTSTSELAAPHQMDLPPSASSSTAARPPKIKAQWGGLQKQRQRAFYRQLDVEGVEGQGGRGVVRERAESQ
jgi:hypothetical protein